MRNGCFYSIPSQIFQQSNFTVRFSRDFYVQDGLAFNRLRAVAGGVFKLKSLHGDKCATERSKLTWDDRVFWTDALIATDSRKGRQIVLMFLMKLYRLDTAHCFIITCCCLYGSTVQQPLVSCEATQESLDGVSMIDLARFCRESGCLLRLENPFHYNIMYRICNMCFCNGPSETPNLQKGALCSGVNKRSQCLHWILYRLLVSFFESRLEWASFLASTLCTNRERNQPLSLLSENLLHRSNMTESFTEKLVI